MTWKREAVLFPIPPTISAQKQPAFVSRRMHRNNETSWGTDSLLYHIRWLLNKRKILHEERSSGFAELSETTLGDHLILGWLSVPGPLIYLSLPQERPYKARSPLESLFLPLSDQEILIHPHSAALRALILLPFQWSSHYFTHNHTLPHFLLP